MSPTKAMTTPDPARLPLRPPWQVALYAFLITALVGIAVGLAAAVASGSIDRSPGRAGEQFGRALLPFVLAITIAAYAIQRSRVAASKPDPSKPGPR